MATPRVKNPQKGGRKSKWETHVKPNLDRIPKLRRQGYHEEQIAEILGVAKSTFWDYKRKYPELAGVLNQGRTSLIEDLEDTLYRKALGLIKVTDTKKYIKKTKNGEETRVEETIKEIPPDTGALIFSLKNLSPDKWKDIHETSGVSELTIAMDNFESLRTQLKNIDMKDNNTDE